MWPTVLLLRAAQTQWRVVSTWGGLIWLGLDYAALPALAAGLGLEPIRWDDLRIMEIEAAHVLNGGD